MKDQKASYLSDSQQYEQQHMLQQLIKKSYRNQAQLTNDISLYVQIDQISQWVKSNNQKPLLITSDQFGGKKTLLCQFIQHFQKAWPNSFVISQFASVTPYYSEILYKITMQLRNLLKINQKVQLNQQKLRQYFRYWLQVADERIQKDYLGYTKQQKRQFIIIIQGIDKVVDQKNQQVRPSFWLPDVNLKNIKIILTAQNGSAAMNCISSKVSQKIQYLIPDSKIVAVKQKLYKQNEKLKRFDGSTHFGDLKFALKILKSHPKLQIGEKNLTFEQFFFKFIQYSKVLLDQQENIYYLLGCLIWNKKGLTLNTLRRAYKLSAQKVERFLDTFKDIIMQTNDTYMIINRKMRLCINKIISQKIPQEQQIKKKTHIYISKSLKRQNNTVNILQQMIYHLSSSGNFTELKQLLSRIQNFLVLYTPLTKHLLCVCWFQLQIQFQYDPVFEYNKAVQRFLNHYYPPPQDTFKIIFQLSLFFKQYSEFENTKTPQFRHPPIRGQVDQLKEISIYDELIHMNMYQKCKIKNRDSLQENLDSSNPNKFKNQKRKDPLVQTTKQKDKIKQKQAQKQKMKTVRQNKQKDIQKQTKSLEYQDNQISANEKKQGKQVEKLNVRIKFHQQKFKSLYLQEMQQYINEFYLLKNKNNNNKSRVLDEDSDDSENQMDQTKIDVQKIKRGLLLKKFPDFCQEQYYRCIQKRSFYYYKQWIWMQFPWICQSLNSHYSQLIQKCVKSPTDYMSIDLQTKLISEAVKIAKIAKQNKKQIYQNQSSSNNMKIQLKTSNQIKHNNGADSSVLTGRTKMTKHKTTYIKQRQKFDVTKIDEQIANNQQKNRRNHKKKAVQNQSAIFMTDLTMNHSYVEDKQNTQLNTHRSRLPNILKCSTIAASKAEKNIDIVDTRQYGLLVTKYDQIKYQNEQLIQKIQLIQLNQQSLKQNNKQNQKLQIRQKIQDLKAKKIKILKNFKTQQALKAKLEIIIKLCDINKSHGSESADLSNFLNSLKLMFKIQQENLDSINKNCKKILEDSKLQYKKIKEQKINLQNKLKKEKSRFQKTFLLSNANQNQKATSKGKTISNNSTVKKRKKSVGKQQLKKKNKIDKQIQNINNLLKVLKDQLGFQIGDFNKNQQTLSNFQSSIDKLNQISWKLNELMDQNTQKQGKIASLQDKLNVNKGHREHRKQLKQRQIQLLINNNLSNTQQRIRCLQQCFNLIQDQRNQGSANKTS